MIIIRNGKIIDGTGKPPYQADIIVSRDRIAAIGNFPNQKNAPAIDALGCYLMPGFIEPATRSDRFLTLFTEPRQDDFLLQGVTTIIGGQGGMSLAPLSSAEIPMIRKISGGRDVNLGWLKIDEYLNSVNRQGIGVNFATLTGHDTLRRFISAASLRDLTPDEERIFSHLFKQSVKNGALGLSLNLTQSRGRAIPKSEIKFLCRLAAENNALISAEVGTTSAAEARALAELLEAAGECRTPLAVSCLKPFSGQEKIFYTSLELLKNLAPKVNYGIAFSDCDLATLNSLMPPWLQKNPSEKILKNLEAFPFGEKILDELKQFNAKNIILVRAPYASYLQGKRLSQFSASRGLSNETGLLTILKNSSLKALILVKRLNPDAALEVLKNNEAFLVSAGASINEERRGFVYEQLTQIFPGFLAAAQKLKLMTLEEAVKKISSLPAKIYGLQDRGTIKEKNYADLVIMKDERVKHVLVNGNLAVSDGQIQKSLSGKALKKSR